MMVMLSRAASIFGGMDNETAGRGGHRHGLTSTDGSAMRAPLLHEATTGAILGAFFRVYRTLGSGFLEAVYERSLDVELRLQGLFVEAQVAVTVHYRGVEVGLYRADLLVNRKILVEVKAASALVIAHEQQTLNYLKATNLEVGLLLNFGPRPTFKRILLTTPRTQQL